MYLKTIRSTQALMVVATTSLLGIMTYWKIAYVETYVPDFRNLHQKSKFVAMPMAMDKHKDKDEACRVRWKVKSFDPEFYENGIYDIKQLHAKVVPPKKKIPVPVNKNPVHKLDPNRFIIPALEGGPNNQVFCLRETMFLGIKMNRTLVIPKFFKHFTDSQNKGTTFVYPGHRINLEDVCSFVSCINLKQFQETCQEKMDAVMLFGSHIVAKKMQQNMGLRVGKADGFLDDLEILPHSTEDQPYPRKDKVASTEIEEYFSSEARCLAYDKPLFNLLIDIGKRLRPAMVPMLDAKSENTSDIILMREITRRTQAPKYIGKLAENFIKSLVGNRPLVTAHWRYNKGDYLQRCQSRVNRNSTKKSGQDRFCESALHFTADAVAVSMKEKLTRISQEFETTHKRTLDIRDVYIASPPSERPTVENISKILLRDMNCKVYSSLELEDFLSEAHGDCGFVNRHLNDVASTLEMEICARGIVYLSSPRSTWSANVKLSRKFCTRSGTFPLLDTYIIT